MTFTLRSGVTTVVVGGFVFSGPAFSSGLGVVFLGAGVEVAVCGFFGAGFVVTAAAVVPVGGAAVLVAVCVSDLFGFGVGDGVVDAVCVALSCAFGFATALVAAVFVPLPFVAAGLFTPAVAVSCLL